MLKRRTNYGNAQNEKERHGKRRQDAYEKDPKTGKMIPAFAMDGKGKMNRGGSMKKKGMARGGMKKKGYSVGGASKGMTLAQIRAAAKDKGYKLTKA